MKRTAGMGGRGGKDAPKKLRGTVTPRRKRKTGGGKTLERPSPPKANQRRNQREWSKKKAMRTRY
jgi:hypothetical protein